MVVRTHQQDFTEFYSSAAAECLPAVVVSVGDQDRAADGPAASAASASGVDPQIMAALMRLPARQREVVALRLILDLDTARTAEILGIAPGTVMAHMGRAMAALRLDLQPGLRQESRP
jgi:DNA-directed RNA polymerase specialized sigma24 family protein